jgi:hypothetical protein
LFDEWVERAKSVRVVEALRQIGHFRLLKKAGIELVGPCPLCRGTDRFSVHPAKDVWNCRGCGIGGDAIRLVRNVEGCGFLQAVERLTGEPAPGGAASESDAERAARHARHVEAIERADAEDHAKAAQQADYRERERRRMWTVWESARPIAGTDAARYLRKRGGEAPPEADLRFLPNYALWDGPPPNGKVVHRGPAMLAKIVGPDKKFAGVHATWIDLADPDGKARVADAKTGELVPAKKVRGSQRGGSILLARPATVVPKVLFIGEGIETVLSIYWAMTASAADLLDVAEFRSGVALGNLAGRARGRVAHPTERQTDKLGRVKRVLIGDGIPHPDDRTALIPLGDGIETIILLGDGDSEPVRTRLALERAAMRFSAAYPWVSVGLAMAPDDMDFNDLWRAIEAERTEGADEPSNAPCGAL